MQKLILIYLWHCRVAKYPLKNGYAPSNDDIVGDVFHDGGCFPSDQRQEYGSMVEIPEEKEFTSAGCRAAHVSEEVRVGIPEYPVEAQYDLVEVSEAQTFDGCDFPVGQRRNELNDVLTRRRVWICVRDGMFEYTQR